MLIMKSSPGQNNKLGMLDGDDGSISVDALQDISRS